MNFIGIDLHKKTISVCVVNKDRQVLARQKLWCDQPERIVAFFESQQPFSSAVEATGGYEWLLTLIEPWAEATKLVHPRKMRIIAESARKSDKLDAQVLAEFLAVDMIPEAYRPSKRERSHRILVRQRYHISKRLTSVRNRIRRIMSDYNADREDLFSEAGLEYLHKTAVLDADRFVLQQLLGELKLFNTQMAEVDKKLAAFAKKAPAREAASRALLHTVPGVGTVTVDVFLSEVGDVRRFGSQKKICAYAGLAPGQRESDGKSLQLGISKQGSGLMRWILVQAAWRLRRTSARWRAVFDRLVERRGKKKAIVALARRLLCVMHSVLKSGRPYDPAMV